MNFSRFSYLVKRFFKLVFGQWKFEDAFWVPNTERPTGDSLYTIVWGSSSEEISVIRKRMLLLGKKCVFANPKTLWAVQRKCMNQNRKKIEAFCIYNDSFFSDRKRYAYAAAHSIPVQRFPLETIALPPSAARVSANTKSTSKEATFAPTSAPMPNVSQLLEQHLSMLSGSVLRCVGESWLPSPTQNVLPPLAVIWGVPTACQDNIANLLGDDYRSAFITSDGFSKDAGRTLDCLSDFHLFAWGNTVPDEMLEYAAANNITIQTLLPGLIGPLSEQHAAADISFPQSLFLDYAGGRYYDASKPSQLEEQIRNFSADDHHDAMRLVPECLKTYIGLRISQENAGLTRSAEEVLGRHSISSRVLVIGQHGDDVLLKFGNPERRTTADLLEMALKENPEAEILYWPISAHVAIPPQETPEDEEERVNEESRRSDVLRANSYRIITLDADINFAEILELCDKIYVISANAGFEGVIRKKTVVVAGMPFYAGWGLTDDRCVMPEERRGVHRSIEELFFCVNIHQRKYPTKTVSETANFLSAALHIFHKQNVASYSALVETAPLDTILQCREWPVLFREDVITRLANTSNLGYATAFMNRVHSYRDTVRCRMHPESMVCLIAAAKMLRAYKDTKLDERLLDVLFKSLSKVDSAILANVMEQSGYWKDKLYFKQIKIIYSDSNLSAVFNADEKVLALTVVMIERYQAGEQADVLLNKLVSDCNWYGFSVILTMAVLDNRISEHLLFFYEHRFGTGRFHYDDASLLGTLMVKSMVKDLTVEKFEMQRKKIEAFSKMNVALLWNINKNMEHDEYFRAAEFRARLIGNLCCISSGDPLWFILFMNSAEFSVNFILTSKEQHSLSRFKWLSQLVASMVFGTRSFDVGTSMGKLHTGFLNAILDASVEEIDRILGITNSVFFDSIESVRVYIDLLYFTKMHEKIKPLLCLIEEKFGKNSIYHHLFISHKASKNMMDGYHAYEEALRSGFSMVDAPHFSKVLFLRHYALEKDYYRPSIFSAKSGMSSMSKDKKSSLSKEDEPILFNFSRAAPGGVFAFLQHIVNLQFQFPEIEYWFTCDERIASVLQRSIPWVAKWIVQRYSPSKLPAIASAHEYSLLPDIAACHQIGNNDVWVASSKAKTILTPNDLFNFSKYIRLSKQPSPYILPDDELVDKLRHRLAQYHPKVCVGLSWRSSSLSVDRNFRMMDIRSFTPLFENLDNVQFIALQSDECDEEIEWVERRFPGKLVKFRDMDIYNDFEALTALIAALDLTVTLPNNIGETVLCLNAPSIQFSSSYSIRFRDANGYKNTLSPNCECSGPYSQPKEVMPRLLQRIQDFIDCNRNVEIWRNSTPIE